MKHIYVKQTIVINRPAEVVFAYLSNLEHMADWSSAVLSVRMLSSSSMQVGTSANIVTRFLGKRSEAVMEIVECYPHRYLTLKSTSGIIPCTFFYQFDSREKSVSSIDLDATYMVKRSVRGLSEQKVINALQRQREYDLLTLKDVLEAGTPRYYNLVGA